MTGPKTSPELMRALDVLANMPTSERRFPTREERYCSEECRKKDEARKRGERRPPVSEARLEWGPPPEGVRIGFRQPTLGQRAYAIGKGSDGHTYLVYAQPDYEPVFARIAAPSTVAREAETRDCGWYVWPPEVEP